MENSIRRLLEKSQVCSKMAAVLTPYQENTKKNGIYNSVIYATKFKTYMAIMSYLDTLFVTVDLDLLRTLFYKALDEVGELTKNTDLFLEKFLALVEKEVCIGGLLKIERQKEI
ncbi:hypothetical protein DRN98_04705 [Methanosarcinales archaeon]|nr:MAG: hypothetical protein DRN98_04705 [Methanosarcinales archaeon]